LTEDFERRFIKPITSASYPATLAALTLTVYRVAAIGGDPPFALRTVLLLGATSFLWSALSMFFYSLYPTKGKLWTSTACLYLFGLFSLMTAVLIILASPAE
jgi:hypothetical protein